MTSLAVPKHHTIIDSNRRRLGTILAAARQKGIERKELVDALEEKIELSESVSPWEVPDDVVIMNSRFRIRDLDTNGLETYTLVYPDGADIAERSVSVLAPIGMAVLGCRIGDEIELHAPAGILRLRLEDILD